MATGQQDPEQVGPQDRDRDAKIGLDREDEDHDFVDQSKIDFDPDEGLYSGTAVHGNTEIPGPHQDNETGEVDYEDVKRQAGEQAGHGEPRG